MKALSASSVLALLVFAACDGKKPEPARVVDAGAPAKTSAAPVTSSAHPTASSAVPAVSRAAQPGVPEPIAKACAAYAATLCARRFSCFAMEKVLFADEAQCKERLALECAIDLAADDVTATPDAMAGCEKKIAQAACKDLEPRDFAECRSRGKRPVGAACGLDAQCESGDCENGTADDVRWRCGKCEPARKEGEACKEGDACAPGLSCAKGKCAKAVEVGAACDATKPCHESTCVGGKCAAFAKAGDACDPAFTRTAMCDPGGGLECDEKAKKCVAPAFVSAGGACGEVAGAGDKFCVGGRCIAEKCVPLAVEGAACESAHDCLAPAYCADKKCALPAPSACK